MQQNEIAIINDRLRKSVPFVPPPHRMVMTSSVASLNEVTLLKVFEKVRAFSEFDPEENDPHGERDFGSVSVEGTKYFWKFDYYDERFEFFKENGVRVLTIMRANEY